jgi:hypothetical protein
MLSHVVIVPDNARQPAGSGKDSLPVIVVLSVYDPVDVLIQVPFTWIDPPVNVVDLHGVAVVPAPSPERFNVPVGSRHPDSTVQVPTRLPPQAVTAEMLVHDVALPPLELDDALAPDEVPELEPEFVPDDDPELDPDPPELELALEGPASGVLDVLDPPQETAATAKNIPTVVRVWMDARCILIGGLPGRSCKSLGSSDLTLMSNIVATWYHALPTESPKPRLGSIFRPRGTIRAPTYLSMTNT